MKNQPYMNSRTVLLGGMLIWAPISLAMEPMEPVETNNPIPEAPSMTIENAPLDMEPVATNNPILEAPSMTIENAPLDIENRQWRTGLLISSYIFGTALYGYFAWWDKDTQKHRFTEDGTLVVETIPNRTSDFRVTNEGWFAKDTPNGGADKLGHAYSAYLSTRLMTKGFQWAGHDQWDAAKLAGLTAGAVMLGVEIMDGFTVEYGFSKEDLTMNLAGVGAATLFEMYPHLDDLFDIRFRYWRSDDAKKLGEGDPIADYSGQTYFFMTKASGIPQLKKSIWLRYWELAIGYGSKGYQPNPGQFEDTQPKKRFVYYGLSLNLSQLLNDTIFLSGHYPTTQKVTTGLLEYLQMPGTALLFHTEL